MGEDVGKYGGSYAVTKGLLDEFGENRVVDSPIAELGFAGVGVGSAMASLRPVIEFMTWNFALLAIDQIVNSAAKLLYMSGGQFSVPIVFRGPNGAALQLGAQHSQAFESWLAHIPGLKVVDMSGDFRLRDPASYERWYRHVHPCPELLPEFVYGLPEQNRERIRAARFVASPGCFATTIELALLPLARAGLLEGVVHVQGITGSSGSGVAPSAGTHHPVRAGNLRTYKPFEHQHVPEIEQTLRDAGAPSRARFFM